MSEAHWLFESDTLDPNVPAIIAEVRRQGMRAEVASYVPLYSGTTYKDIYDPDECVVFYGSINFADQIQQETNWLPGAYGVTSAHNCTSYYPHLSRFLLNQTFKMFPFRHIHDFKEGLYEDLGLDGTIFIRPNRGNKIFSGQTITYERFEKDVDRLGFYDVPGDEIVVVSPPRNVLDEWRFVIVDGTVVAGSRYRQDNKSSISREIDPRALEMAKRVVAAGYEPARAWTLDVCRTTADNYYLLEIGCVSCAGWYGCDPEPIVREVSRVAREDSIW